MDFFSYLQNSGKKNNSKNCNDSNDNSNSNLNSNLKDNSFDVLNNNFKQGETVIINKYNNSDLNMYKGYFAFIKHYKKNSDHAFVIFPAMNYPKLIKMPIAHFSKIHKT
jgi:plasmid replication initiation protein